PMTRSPRHFSVNGARSSGWIAACQPQPFDSSGDRPVYSCQRLLRNSFEPSDRLHQASVGIVSITCRSFLSEFCSSSSALLSASWDRGRVTEAIGRLLAAPSFTDHKCIIEISGRCSCLCSTVPGYIDWCTTCTACNVSL